MAPRKNNLIPDMRETRYKTETFANPYAPVAPKQTAFRTPKMSATAMPKSGFDLGGFIKWGFGGPISKEQQAINQAKEDSETVNLFGRTVKTSDLVGLAATAALTGAGIYAARTGMQARASTRSLAAARVRQAGEIAANRESARLQFRDMVESRRAARVARRASNLRISRLERIEANLRERDPLMAQAAGDRAWSIRQGQAIRTVLRGRPGYRNERMPRTAIGYHQGRYVPMEDAVPGDFYQSWWNKEIGPRRNMRLGELYSSGNPMEIRGGSGLLKRPNLRTRTPLSRKYTDEGNPIVGKEDLDDTIRSQVAELLDDATTFRNRSASMLQGTPQSGGRGRFAFPRIYQEQVTYPRGSYDPARYQIDAFTSYVRGQKSRPSRSNRRRIGGGK